MVRIRRIRRIEGHVRGIERMVARDADPIEVLAQIAAVTKALQSVAVLVVDQHVRRCFGAAMQSNDASEADRLLREATEAIERLSSF